MYQKGENLKVSTSAELNRVWSVIIPMLWKKEIVLCTLLDDLCKTVHFLDNEFIFPDWTLGCINCKLLPHNPSPDHVRDVPIWSLMWGQTWIQYYCTQALGIDSFVTALGAEELSLKRQVFMHKRAAQRKVGSPKENPSTPERGKHYIKNWKVFLWHI